VEGADNIGPNNAVVLIGRKDSYPEKFPNDTVFLF
jgi:hypothetical protein